MDENTTQGSLLPSSDSVATQPVEPQSTSPLQQKQPKQNILWKVLVFCMALLIIGMGLFIIYMFQQQSTLSSLSTQDTVTSIETLPKEVDPTEDWNIYSQSDNLFRFKYPTNMSIAYDNEAGVGYPLTGNPQEIVTIMDKKTAHPGTDFPFSGFSVKVVDFGANTFEEYLNNEVTRAKNGPRVFENETISKLINPNAESVYIDYESNIRVYFIKVPNQNKAIVFSTASRDPSFLTVMEQIIVTNMYQDQIESSGQNWKTYTEKNNTIKYPNGWTVVSQSNGFTVQKDEYGVNFITHSEGFEPDICIFSDQMDFNNPFLDNPILADSKCPGDFYEFHNAKNAHRRQVIPLKKEQNSIWSLYTKTQEDSFVTVPPITYTAPINFDPVMINLMDQIVSTYEYTN